VKAPVRNAIVLIHNPRPIIEALVVMPVLILAGHLHGGQWVLWKDAKGAGWPPAMFYPWCGDRWALQEGHLIVSRGLGDTFPMRIRCPREMVIIDIHCCKVSKPGCQD
jgi:predicted MPP superfamily phosphohydrolase